MQYLNELMSYGCFFSLQSLCPTPPLPCRPRRFFISEDQAKIECLGIEAQLLAAASEKRMGSS